MNVKRWDRVAKHIADAKFDEAIAELETELAAFAFPEFQPLIAQDFTEDPANALEFINEMIEAWQKRGGVGAIYLEMNGYDVNTDEWYFDGMGYKKDGGHTDHEWLCDWDYAVEDDCWVLEGMEACQQFFEWYHAEEKYEEKRYNEAYDIAVLLVMTKFVRYIGRVLASGPLAAKVPVYATAHEFDIIARFPAK